MEAYGGVLGDRLVGLAAHGSAVTGYIAGFSDFDFVLVVRDFISPSDAAALHAALAVACPDSTPFTYLQLSAVVDIADSSRRRHGLIESAHAVLAGALPSDWEFNSEEDLRAAGRERLKALPGLVRIDSLDWAADTGAQRARRIRVMMTRLKPAVRAILVNGGVDVMEAWTADWYGLAKALTALDADRGLRMSAILSRLPSPPADEMEVGAIVLAFLGDLAGEYGRQDPS